MSGSGKTTVAPEVAALLHVAWCDLDRRVADRAGQSVVDLFRRYGEQRFRELERDEMAAALVEPPQVIAAGGGWASDPGNLAAAKAAAAVVYLSISPEEAATRLEGAGDRPLLDGASLVGRLAAQLAIREPFYSQADAVVPAGERTPEAVASAVVEAVRQLGNW
ncbi:MAG: shikimate kinase [Gemmatimonadales bacterium]